MFLNLTNNRTLSPFYHDEVGTVRSQFTLYNQCKGEYGKWSLNVVGCCSNELSKKRVEIMIKIEFLSRERQVKRSTKVDQ